MQHNLTFEKLETVIVLALGVVGETSEAIGNRTQRDKRRAGALMANTDGLFGALAGEFTI